ncbi:quinone oxidoreductase family protein [Halomonas campaniensis]|uniref:NADPH:quinone reductase n=1 Tax=Halomonas campaniensis TaxID=213554 RepID=A0A246S1S3_9GAMM|nr:quinone oxidoreductase [Halomonas campaniensis]OWV29735.1 quinone oxidoreductase [Halomonas campaniensis]
MHTVIRFERPGHPEVLEAFLAKAPAPTEGEVLLKQRAVGVNFLDVTQRNGAVPIPLPSGLGLEGAGIVEAIGSGVEGFRPGDRVAYATGPLGAYAASRCIPASRLVKLPDDVSFEDAAAVLFKGITAQYLLKSTYEVKAGTKVMIYGVAGGVGDIMARWAKHLGAYVIGVVSRAVSIDKAKAAGCDDVFVFDAEQLPRQVAAATNGDKVDVVYDPIGRSTFNCSLECLRPRGLMVSFGASSGAPATVEVSQLNAKGSLFLTRPSLAAHTATDAEYQERAADVISALRAGIIVARIWRTFPLLDVAQAHEALESGHSQGTIVLIP